MRLVGIDVAHLHQLLVADSKQQRILSRDGFCEGGRIRRRIQDRLWGEGSWRWMCYRIVCEVRDRGAGIVALDVSLVRAASIRSTELNQPIVGQPNPDAVG